MHYQYYTFEKHVVIQIPPANHRLSLEYMLPSYFYFLHYSMYSMQPIDLMNKAAIIPIHHNDSCFVATRPPRCIQLHEINRTHLLKQTCNIMRACNNSIACYCLKY